MVELTASQASSLLIKPVLIASAHDVARVSSLLKWSVELPSGAINTPNVSYAWWGSSRRSFLRSPEILST